MSTVKIDVIIPAYRPGEEFEKLLERLSAQKYPINRIIVMNTEKRQAGWNITCFCNKNSETGYPYLFWGKSDRCQHSVPFDESRDDGQVHTSDSEGL